MSEVSYTVIIPEMAFYQDFLSRELNEEDAPHASFETIGLLRQTNKKELCLLWFLKEI